MNVIPPAGVPSDLKYTYLYIGLSGSKFGPYHVPNGLVIVLFLSKNAFLPVNFEISANPFIFLVECSLPCIGCYNTWFLPYLPQPCIDALYIEVGYAPTESE